MEDGFLICFRLREEGARHFFARALEDLLRWARLGDAAGVHDVDRVGDVAGEAHGVSDDDHGLATFGQVGDDTDYLGRHRGSRALVGSSNRMASGFIASAASDGDALLLAAGELFGHRGEFLVEADAGQELARFRLSVVARAVQHVQWPGKHVVEDASCAGRE